jgi:hypothetical protein
MGERTIIDQIAALIFHNLPDRFPGLRMLIVEYGAAWLPHLLKTLDKIYRLGDHRSRWAFGKPVAEAERNLPAAVPHRALLRGRYRRRGARGRRAVRAPRLGLPAPRGPACLRRHAARARFAFSGAEQRRIMRGNAAELLGLAP